MGIPHGGRDARVTEQLLHGEERHASRHEVACKRVSKGVPPDRPKSRPRAHSLERRLRRRVGDGLAFVSSRIKEAGLGDKLTVGYSVLLLAASLVALALCFAG